MTAKARVGVVGTGWWATRVHLPALADYERADVVGVVDTDTERAAVAAEKFGAPHSFDDIADLLDLGVDAVVIATPHDTHYPLAAAALSAGADVLIEKPMVIDPADGRHLVELAEQVGRRIHVGYPYPLAELSVRLRSAITDGELGELQLVTSVFATPAGALFGDGQRWAGGDDALVGPDPATWNSPAVGGGEAYGQLTHAISLLLFCTGLRIDNVAAHTANFGLAVDLVDTATFRATNGALGTIAATGGVGLGRPTVESIGAFGTTGHAIYDMAGGTLLVHRAGATDEHGPYSGERRYPERAPARALVDDFLDGNAPRVDGRLGLAAVDFVDCVLRSARTGNPAALEQSSTGVTTEQEATLR
jgi:predicted dehydrogenase